MNFKTEWFAQEWLSLCFIEPNNANHTATSDLETVNIVQSMLQYYIPLHQSILEVFNKLIVVFHSVLLVIPFSDIWIFHSAPVQHQLCHI